VARLVGPPMSPTVHHQDWRPIIMATWQCVYLWSKAELDVATCGMRATSPASDMTRRVLKTREMPMGDCTSTLWGPQDRRNRGAIQMGCDT
jgi:hypothetical protein